MKIKTYFLLTIVALCFSSCHVGRYFYWNFADTNDHNKFEQVPIHKSDIPFTFKEVENTGNAVIPKEIIGKKGVPIPFNKALEKSGTTAFLVIKDDQILYETYFDDYTPSTDHPSFSVAKSFISALIGIAIDEGKISSIDDPIRTYLPELDESFNPVTIAHILNMQSGVKFSEGYFNPFGEVAKFYYGTNLKKFVTKLRVTKTPGTSWKYISGNTQLLSLALENATQQSLQTYFEEKLWKPLGMEYDASWNIDSKKNQIAKAFCCLNARARDFAKFGRLYAHLGNWEGQQIISEDWVLRTTSFDDPVNHNLYSHHWWRNIAIGGITSNTNTLPAPASHTDYQARGILGQFIYVHPEKDIVIVRLGHKFGSIDWSSLFREIANNN